MKKILLTIFLMLSAWGVQAQTARALFDSIPEPIVPLLSYMNRTDFFDFLDSNMRARVKNKLDNESEMTLLTDDYIHIRMTSQSTWEMKVLPLNDSIKVICVVSTVCAPVCDSDIHFYTFDWKEVPASDFIQSPVMDDYFLLTDSTKLDDYNRFRKKADMLLAKAEVGKETATLTFVFTTPEYIKSKEDALEEWTSYLRPPLVYHWQYNLSKAQYGFEKADDNH